MNPLKKIKLVVFDVDGVLTDGSLFYSASGEELKKFNVKDGVAVKMLQKHDIPVAVISAKKSAPLEKRMTDLNVKFFRPGSTDKWAVLSNIMSELEISPNEVAYVGDDMIDVPVMTQVGFSVSPADGYWQVREIADWVTTAKGGEGVAREVADKILSATYDLKEIYGVASTSKFETDKH